MSTQGNITKKAAKPAAEDKGAIDTVVDIAEVAAAEDTAAEGEQKRAPRGQQGRGPRRREDRPKEENPFIERVINIRRVTKVTKGGKNMGFTALVVVGDAKGKVAFALGKAPEVADAIRKGLNQAKKHMAPIAIENGTLPHEMVGRFGAHEVMLKPASSGTGIIASGPVRAICEAAGIKNVLTKVLTKSANPINIVKATFAGLNGMKA
jgi:small subunit ribosomal protein S5